MKKKFIVFYLFLALITAFIFSVNAFAYITDVSDLNTSDLNVIVDQSRNPEGYVVDEEYGETHVIAYPYSHNDYAVVNGNNEFFTKEISISEQGVDTLIFNVKNTSPYSWCDYHFIFNQDVNLTAWSSSVFQNSLYDTSRKELSFWEPNWVNQGETVTFTLTLNPDQDFIVDQVATVPIPGAFLLFASGFLGLMGSRNRNKE